MSDFCLYMTAKMRINLKPFVEIYTYIILILDT